VGKGGGRRGAGQKGRRRQAKGRKAKKKPIDPASAYTGALGTRKNARRLFNDALLLHNKKRFRGAIPLAILAIEESLKGIELGISFRKLKSITAEEQGWMASHWHKLGHVHDWIVRHMEDERMGDVHAGLAREGKVPHEGGRPISLEDIAENARRTRDMVRGLQHLKEMCMYEGWDWSAGAWRGMDIGDDDAEALSMFVLAMAMMHYDMLHGSTAFALAALVARNPKLEKYREKREELDTPVFDLDTAQRGEDMLWGMYGKAGARGGD